MDSKVDLISELENLIDSITKMQEYQRHFLLTNEYLSNIYHIVKVKTKQLQFELGKENFRKVLLRLASQIRLIKNLIKKSNESSKETETIKISENRIIDINYKLIQIQADLTTNIDMKKQILISGINIPMKSHKIQRKLQASLDKAIVTVEADSQLKTIYKKHTDIINSYLCQCLNEHNSVLVVGLNISKGEFWSKITDQSLSGTSNEHNPTWQQRLGTINLPLEGVYTHLKVDNTSSYERKQVQQKLRQDDEENDNDDFDDSLFGDKEYDYKLWDRLSRYPTMQSSREQNRSKSTNIIHSLCNNRWIVVLGDPGSGKTTCVRWLVYKMASSLSDLFNGRENIKVDHDFEDKSSFDIGPKRMPILIRVGEFVNALSKDRRLTLWDYIGHHTWIGSSALNHSKSLSEQEKLEQNECLKSVLHECIQHGLAIVILDGLDEIPASAGRAHLIKLIEDFANDHVRTPNNISVLDAPFVTIGTNNDKPKEIGGNQLFITSRIVGYHAHPLSGQFSHHTLKPLEIAYIEKFISHWFQNVYQQGITSLERPIDETILSVKSEEAAHKLQKQINTSNNSRLFQLAANPCLLNFLCCISLQSLNSKLPIPRIRLYDQITSSLLDMWNLKNPSTVRWNRYDFVLCDIAEYIHQNCPSGLIEETELRRVCTESLITLLGPGNETLAKDQTNQCLNTFSQNTGVLVPRGQHLYGFLHLTFQEYYTSKNFVNKDKLLQKAINKSETTFAQQFGLIFHKHASDPRYHMILSLALGWLSWKKVENDEFQNFCSDLLTNKSDFDQLLPVDALLLINSLDDFLQLPSKELLFRAADQLLFASTEYHWHTYYKSLEEQMINGLSQHPKKVLTEWIIKVLSSADKSSSDIVSTLCHILIAIDRVKRGPRTDGGIVVDEPSDGGSDQRDSANWVNQEIFKLLSRCLDWDNEENEFAIDSLLVMIASDYPEIIPTYPNSL